MQNFYHATSQANAKLILATGGIEPHFTEGKIFGAWYAVLARMPWAVQHVCKRHKIAQADAVVLAVYEDERYFVRMSSEGYCFTQLKFEPVAALPADRAIRELLPDVRFITTWNGGIFGVRSNVQAQDDVSKLRIEYTDEIHFADHKRKPVRGTSRGAVSGLPDVRQPVGHPDR